MSFDKIYLNEKPPPNEDELAYIEHLRGLVFEAYNNRPREVRVEWKTVCSFWNEEARRGEEVVSLKERVEYPYFDNSMVHRMMKYLRDALHQIYGKDQGQKLYEQYIDYIPGPFEDGIRANH